MSDDAYRMRNESVSLKIVQLFGSSLNKNVLLVRKQIIWAKMNKLRKQFNGILCSLKSQWIQFMITYKRNHQKWIDGTKHLSQYSVRFLVTECYHECSLDMTKKGWFLGYIQTTIFFILNRMAWNTNHVENDIHNESFLPNIHSDINFVLK